MLIVSLLIMIIIIIKKNNNNNTNNNNNNNNNIIIIIASDRDLLKFSSSLHVESVDIRTSDHLLLWVELGKVQARTQGGFDGCARSPPFWNINF